MASRSAGAANTDGFPGWFGWSGRPAPSFVRHAPLVAGKIVDGSLGKSCSLTRSGRRKATSPAMSRKWPTVLILHGSNMNGAELRGDDRRGLARHRPRFHHSGHQRRDPVQYRRRPALQLHLRQLRRARAPIKGFPGTDRESPALVSQAMFELKEVYPIDHYLVGGHSQGGFLTYSLLDELSRVDGRRVSDLRRRDLSVRARRLHR